MKKWIVITLSLVILLLAGSYFFIPDKIVVTRAITANANQSGVYRFLTDASNWSRWWPGSSDIDKGVPAIFESGGYKFKKTTEGYNSLGITIEKNKTIDSSILHIFSLNEDSLAIEWVATINTGSNPLTKIRHYFKAKNLGKKLEVVLTAMQDYISIVKNIYGFDIKREKIQMEFMVSIKKSFDHLPTTEDIYTEMNQIRKHIAQVKAVENSYPILNISPIDSSGFELVVAVPVDRQVPDSGVFTDRRLLKNGNILVAEITGGTNTVNLAIKQIDIYAHDHKYLNVAIPFQQFLTDRMKTADTSQWKTKIGYPIL